MDPHRCSLVQETACAMWGCSNTSVSNISGSPSFSYKRCWQIPKLNGGLQLAKSSINGRNSICLIPAWYTISGFQDSCGWNPNLVALLLWGSSQFFQDLAVLQNDSPRWLLFIPSSYILIHFPKWTLSISAKIYGGHFPIGIPLEWLQYIYGYIVI